MNINPGELNKSITIVSKSSGVQNSNGFDTGESETIVRTCWAKVTNTSGKELTTAGQKLSEAKKRFLVRDNGTEITTAMVLRYAGHEYDIQYVNTYGDNKEYIEIWTEAIAAV